MRVLAIPDQCRDVRGQGGGYAVRANVRNEGDGEVLYWLSLRPLEQGRVALMRWDLLGHPEQVIDAPWDVRTGVCEYGGGAYVSVAGTTWFSNFADARLYRVGRGSTPQPLTEPANYRFADLVLDRRRNRLLCVREDFVAAPQHAVGRHSPTSSSNRGRRDTRRNSLRGERRRSGTHAAPLGP